VKERNVMAIVKMQDLLEAGVHFGARASRWNPKMKPYIYGKRSKIHIIDLRETVKGLIRACKFLENTTAKGKKVVFVGTKRQACDAIRSEAQRAEQYFVAERWLGGTLTNLKTVRRRVTRLEELEALEESGELAEFSKKMISQINRERRKITRNFEGIRDMKQLPAALVLVDPTEEKIALKEAMKLDIPVVAIADTDCDPDPVDFLVPANDDAFRSVHLLLGAMADACLRGQEKGREAAMVAARSAEGAAQVGAVSFGGDDENEA
jgi:small subunit ribosomal protein S2